MTTTDQTTTDALDANENVHDGRRRDQSRIVLALMCGFLLVLSAFVVGSILVVREVTGDLNRVETLSNRQDCARSISAEQSAVLRDRDALQAQVTKSVIQLLVTPIEQRANLVPALADLNDKFDKAEHDVEALPPLDVEVERHCPAVTG